MQNASGDNTAQGENEEISTDIVVVGGGAAGTLAALAAAEKGAKVVVWLKILVEE